MRKWLALLGGVVLALALAVGVKTLTMPSRQIAATAVKPIAVEALAHRCRIDGDRLHGLRLRRGQWCQSQSQAQRRERNLFQELRQV